MGSSNLDSRDFLAAPFDFLPPAGRTAKEVADPLLHQPLSHRRGGTAAGQESEACHRFSSRGVAARYIRLRTWSTLNCYRSKSGIVHLIPNAIPTASLRIAPFLLSRFS